MFVFLCAAVSGAGPDAIEHLFARGGGISGRNVTLDFGGMRLRNPSLMFSLPAASSPFKLSFRGLYALRSLSSLLRTSSYLTKFALDVSNCRFSEFLDTPIALSLETLDYTGKEYDGDARGIDRGSVCVDQQCRYDSITVSNCVFRNCNTRTDSGIFRSGGALGILSANAVRVTGCTFASCREVNTEGGYGGGAIYVSESNSVYVEQSTFTDCTAQCGGGLWANQVKNVDLVRTTMARCSSSTREGGGVRCDSGTCRLELTTFEACRGPSTGGAAAAFSEVVMELADWNATACVGSWGILRAQGGSCDMTFSQFVRNQVDAGAAMYANDAAVTIARTVFMDTANGKTDLYMSVMSTGSFAVALDHVCFQNTDASYVPIAFVQLSSSGGQLRCSLIDCYFSGTATWETQGVVSITSEQLHTNAQNGQCNSHTPTIAPPASDTFTGLVTLTDEPTPDPTTTTTTSSSSSPVDPTVTDTPTEPTSSPTPSPTTSGESGGGGSSNIGVIVGSIVAVIVVIIVVVLLSVFCVWRCRKSAVIDRREVSDMEILAFPTV